MMCWGFSAGQPNRWIHGGSRFWTSSTPISNWSGSYRAIGESKTAIITNTVIITKPVTADRWRKKARMACRQRLSGRRVMTRESGLVVVMAIIGNSLKSNAWIEEGVGEIDQQI